MSSDNDIRLGFIIPTKDRPNELNRLLASIYEQSEKPKTIIVVDGSQPPVESGLLRDPSVELLYKRVFPPSLTAQRNAGIAAIPKDLSHIGFLDDDIVILPGSMAALLHGLRDRVKILGGVSFNIVEDGKVFSPFIQRIMGLFPLKRGKVSLGGSVQPNVNLESDLFSEFLCGGATVWRRDILESYSFDESFKGYALWEDVDYSLRVSEKWKLLVIADARVLHLHIDSSATRSQAMMGDVEIVDRFHFYSKHRERLSFLVTSWAGFGTLLKNFYLYSKRKNVNSERLKANISALSRCFQGRFERRN